jgi:hypothetical protein
MNGNDIAILIAFLSFHTFFLVLVRPYTLGVFENFSKDTSRVKKAIERRGKSENGIEKKYKYYQHLEYFLWWEGNISYFSSNYWIYAIIIGIISIFGRYNYFFKYEIWFFFATLLYLIWTIFVFIIRYDNLIMKKEKSLRNYLSLGFNAFVFYIVPSLIYLSYKYKIKIIQIAKNEELSTIYLVWLFSIFIFFIWHSLWAIYAPFSKLKILREELGLVNPLKNAK